MQLGNAALRSSFEMQLGEAALHLTDQHAACSFGSLADYSFQVA